jgi:hypothetical protein
MACLNRAAAGTRQVNWHLHAALPNFAGRRGRKGKGYDVVPGARDPQDRDFRPCDLSELAQAAPARLCQRDPPRLFELRQFTGAPPVVFPTLHPVASRGLPVECLRTLVPLSVLAHHDRCLVCANAIGRLRSHGSPTDPHPLVMSRTRGKFTV